MVKTLLRRDRSEQAEADPSANGHGNENGAAAALLARPPEPGEQPREAPPKESPSGATVCATCGAPLEPDQDWCLNCGTAIARSGHGMRIPAVITGIVLAFALTSTAVAFVALSDDGPGTVTVAENPPPVRAAPPPPPAPARRSRRRLRRPPPRRRPRRRPRHRRRRPAPRRRRRHRCR